jgi:hypothetical protein
MNAPLQSNTMNAAEKLQSLLLKSSNNVRVSNVILEEWFRSGVINQILAGYEYLSPITGLSTSAKVPPRDDQSGEYKQFDYFDLQIVYDVIEERWTLQTSMPGMRPTTVRFEGEMIGGAEVTKLSNRVTSYFDNSANLTLGSGGSYINTDGDFFRLITTDEQLAYNLLAYGAVFSFDNNLDYEAPLKWFFVSMDENGNLLNHVQTDEKGQTRLTGLRHESEQYHHVKRSIYNVNTQLGEEEEQQLGEEEEQSCAPVTININDLPLFGLSGVTVDVSFNIGDSSCTAPARNSATVDQAALDAQHETEAGLGQ